MTRFLGVRITHSVITLVAASFVIFALGRLIGSPADTLLPPGAGPAERDALIERMGLNRPFVEQYLIYLRDMSKGDFGTSLRTGLPVTELVAQRLPNSMQLAAVAILFGIAISLPLGVVAAMNRGRRLDQLAMAVATLGQGIPNFYLGLVGMLVFAVILGWLPTSGTGDWRHFILPASVLAFSVSAGVVRLLRSSMLEVLGTEYVRFARAKGLRERMVIVGHAMPNALIPVVTFVGLMYGLILASAVTTEVVFAWPGLGRLLYEAVLWRDFPLLQFAVLTWVVLIIVLNLLVDLAYLVLDPRIRL